MIIFNKLGSAMAAALLLVAASAATSQAFHTGVYDPAELKCRSTLAKTFTKAISTGQKTIAGCHKTRDKSGGAADCNILDLANADPKGKFAKAKDKIVDGVQKSCIDAGIDLDIVEEYISCPDPCTASLGLPNPLVNFSQLSLCMGCAAGEMAQDFGSATQGLPPGAPLAAADQSCHGAIGKGYGKYLSTILKERTKCQNSAEKEGAVHLEDTGCLTADPKGKIAGALTKAEDGLNGSCAAATLTNLDSCATTNLTDLKNCLLTDSNTGGDDGVTYSYEMPPTICPTRIDSLVQGRTTVTGATTQTRLELGWTGTAHQADLQDNYYISVDVTCPNEAPPCGACTVDGVSSLGVQYNSFLRCSNNLALSCTLPFQNDPACGGNVCSYVLGPPLPVSAGNNPVCTINRLKTDIGGTTDPDTGAGELDIKLSSLVHLGQGLTNPCPVCVGDTIGLDGVKSGTCKDGANNGNPCDVMGYSATFAPITMCVGGAKDGNPCDVNGDCPGGTCTGRSGLSLDCPPGQLANISGAGLNIPLGLTTGSASLPFSNACDSPLGFLDCACGQCSLDTSLPCRDDGECAAQTAGTCTSVGSGVARQPNECGDGACSPAGGDKGTCLAGPEDRFCDGFLDANGNGFLGCSTNGDCAAVDSECGNGTPGSCGNCENMRQRGCFLDPIVATGTPSTINPVTVGTFCLPPTNNAAINGVSGSPGPVRVSVDQLTELHY